MDTDCAHAALFDVLPSIPYLNNFQWFCPVLQDSYQLFASSLSYQASFEEVDDCFSVGILS